MHKSWGLVFESNTSARRGTKTEDYELHVMARINLFYMFSKYHCIKDAINHICQSPEDPENVEATTRSIDVKMENNFDSRNAYEKPKLENMTMTKVAKRIKDKT